MSPRPDNALFRQLPSFEAPWVSLGEFPTPLEELPNPGWLKRSPPLFIKREDQSSPHYGGNKVRTLEVHVGKAISLGAREVWATGAYGSNHAAATVIHARRVGLEPGVMLWPQPATGAAQANLRASLALRPYVWPLTSVVTLPGSMMRLPAKAHGAAYVMSPGGATAEGAVAHVSAAFELAEQLREQQIPEPQAIIVAAGSTCTSAGLLAGIHLAAEMGIGFTKRRPRLHAVRVTPWPVTSRIRIAALAAKTLALVERRSGRASRIPFRQLHSHLTVDHRYLGGGYGRPTRSGLAAIAAMASIEGPALDVVYSGKSAAAFFDLAPTAEGPLIFWATKSTARLPRATARELQLAPKSWRRWLARTAL